MNVWLFLPKKGWVDQLGALGMFSWMRKKLYQYLYPMTLGGLGSRKNGTGELMNLPLLRCVIKNQLICEHTSMSLYTDIYNCMYYVHVSLSSVYSKNICSYIIHVYTCTLYSNMYIHVHVPVYIGKYNICVRV